MDDFHFVVDPGSALSLQHQVRQRLVESIKRGVLRPGRKLPSSRRLARQIGVCRNTVSLAYESLVAEGHLISRARSGVFVAKDVDDLRVIAGRRPNARITPVTARLTAGLAEDAEFRCPPNWHQYPYPFITGRVDASLLPLREWREATRLSFSRQDVMRWGISSGDTDDAMLTEELRTQVLPSRAIEAAPEQVLVMLSLRQALIIVTDLLVARSTPVLIEEQSEPELARLVADRQGTVLPLHSDARGPVLPRTIPAGAVIIVGRRWSSALERDRADAINAAAAQSDALVLEIDATVDVRESRRTTPALCALDDSGRVIHVSALSSLVALGAAPAVVVATPRFVERARQLRRAQGGDLPPNDQRAWAYFIALGHYAATTSRISRTLLERRTALRDALNHYLHKFVAIRTEPGNSAYWVSGAANVNAMDVAREAATLGVLLEPSAIDGATNTLLMGVTSIGRDRIRPGIEVLSRLIRRDPAQGSRRLADETLQPLRGRALRAALSGSTLLYNTVYGDPCTIEVLRDGRLIGRAGYQNEDCDEGRWWIEDGVWVRQWRNWAYGEALGLVTVVDGRQVRWYKADGLLTDTAVFARKERQKKGSS